MGWGKRPKCPIASTCPCPLTECAAPLSVLEHMASALVAADGSCNKKEAMRVGCVLVNTTTGEVVSKAANAHDVHGDTLRHAEMRAVLECVLFGASSDDAFTLFCTHSPCPLCWMFIKALQIDRIYFYSVYGHDFRLYSDPGTPDATNCWIVLPKTGRMYSSYLDPAGGLTELRRFPDGVLARKAQSCMVVRSHAEGLTVVTVLRAREFVKPLLRLLMANGGDSIESCQFEDEGLPIERTLLRQLGVHFEVLCRAIATGSL